MEIEAKLKGGPFDGQERYIEPVLFYEIPMASLARDDGHHFGGHAVYKMSKIPVNGKGEYRYIGRTTFIEDGCQEPDRKVLARRHKKAQQRKD